MTTMVQTMWQKKGFTRALPLFDVLVAALEPKYQAYNIRPDTMPGSVSQGEDVGV